MKIFRSQKYREWIARQACLKCGFGPSEACHEDLGEKGMGMKAPDTHCVPLCTPCHDLEHRLGAETFWQGIDLKKQIIMLLTRYLSERGWL